MPSTNEKSTTTDETASVRSTSTTSSLKALLPRKGSKDSKARKDAKDTKDVSKGKPLAVSVRETPEEKAIRREAVAGYMSMMRY
ncbi:hypothetical protein G647_08109 [Cladophialophora carrionii CBS 160.54]|uniref:Uncharacterized protein n=1 Tax=Cladophialophora carrionii CBS 160.54 TaxID=1279043 RepID=V9CZK9_9EURO|nr:uncharacterized protein G647_08109 [Cladophialophora carrionii CBS 160.54]ETI20075.1 hypothetical protein G647_08109 [Cladophialophora carrionii CBS 160.54]